MGSPLKSYGEKAGASSFPRTTHSAVRMQSSQLTLPAKLSLWSILRPKRQFSLGCACLAKTRIGPTLHSVLRTVEPPSCWHAPVPLSH
jgi:hypothetical protein